MSATIVRAYTHTVQYGIDLAQKPAYTVASAPTRTGSVLNAEIQIVFFAQCGALPLGLGLYLLATGLVPGEGFFSLWIFIHFHDGSTHHGCNDSTQFHDRGVNTSTLLFYQTICMIG